MSLRARDRETLQLTRSIRDDAALLRSRQAKQIGVASQSVGASAVGAMAIGVLSIGALAIGKLAIGPAQIKRLETDELVVRRLRVMEDLSAPGKLDQVAVSVIGLPKSARPNLPSNPDAPGRRASPPFVAPVTLVS